jgi:hypothetical protein
MKFFIFTYGKGRIEIKTAVKKGEKTANMYGQEG